MKKSFWVQKHHKLDIHGESKYIPFSEKKQPNKNNKMNHDYDFSFSFSIDLFTLIGVLAASILSYSVNNSILWALAHGVCNWFYILYYYMFKY